MLQVLVPDRVWAITTPFRFFALSINNNGIIVRVPETGSGNQVLVACNAPKLSPNLATEIRELEKTYNSKLKHVVETDWHHL